MNNNKLIVLCETRQRLKRPGECKNATLKFGFGDDEVVGFPPCQTTGVIHPLRPTRIYYETGYRSIGLLMFVNHLSFKNKYIWEK